MKPDGPAQDQVARAPVQGRRLCDDPPIVIGPNLNHALLAPASAIAPLLGERAAWTLVVVHTTLEKAERRARLAAAYRAHEAAFPRHRVIVLANTAAEAALLAGDGVPAFLSNHNIFVDESVFAAGPDRPAEFDAYYNARLAPYKRHHLCRDIARLALTYSEPEGSTPEYIAEVHAMLPQAVFINEALAQRAYARPAHARADALINRVLAARRYTTLTQRTIAETCNRAAVGLCLSASEGAMYASMEYLMCGLPVVTTPSRGGRDYFFDPAYTLTVDADPRAVREGVDALARRAIARAQIREAVLARVRAERARFLEFLRGLFVEAGAAASFEQASAGLFAGRPWQWHDARGLAGPAPAGGDA